MSSKKLNPFKDFQSDQIQRSSRKIFTAHYACRNAALNLTPVTGTTNGFIFQIIHSLIESWGVRLTWCDCKFDYTIISRFQSLHSIGLAGQRRAVLPLGHGQKSRALESRMRAHQQGRLEVNICKRLIGWISAVA